MIFNDFERKVTEINKKVKEGGGFEFEIGGEVMKNIVKNHAGID